MAGDSKIQWTQKVWNPVAGCSVISPGCTNCYAMKMAGRLDAMGVAAYAGLTRKTRAGAVWTGELRLVESALTQPLRWKKPSLIFVNSMSDLFHDGVPIPVIARVFAVMWATPRHTYQILTKRPARMRAVVGDLTSVVSNLPSFVHLVAVAAGELGLDISPAALRASWPLPNVWLGVSAEDQVRADERIPHLLATPAAVRFVSAEPLLGAIDLTRVGSVDTIRTVHPGMVGWIEQDLRPEPIGGMTMDALTGAYVYQTPNHMGGCAAQGQSPHLDWVIAGGESGPGARPMHPDWPRQLRDQCAAAGVPFFFKQWGTHAWAERIEGDPSTLTAYRAGKRAAGRLLDGIEHNAMPGSHG